MDATGRMTETCPQPRRLADFQFQDMYISRKASHVDVQTVVGGRAQLTPLPASLYDNITDLRNMLQHRTTGVAYFFLDFQGVRLRVQRVETIDGPEFVCKRLFPLPEFSKLPGIPAIVANTFMDLARDQRKGLMLFSGGMSAGSTTTMLSLMRAMQTKYGGLSVVIDDHTEVKVQGRIGEQGRCMQISLAEQTGQDLITSVVARTNPSIVVIADVSTPEKARAAVTLASDGHMVMTTIRAADVFDAISTLVAKLSRTEGAENARDIVARCLLSVWHQQMLDVNRQAGLRQIDGKFVFVTDPMRPMLKQENAHQIRGATTQQWLKAEAGRPIL